MTSKIFNFNVVCYVLAFFVMAYFVIVYFQGCSVVPRSEVYCVKKGDLVKCPKGTPAGTDLDKRSVNAKK